MTLVELERAAQRQTAQVESANDLGPSQPYRYHRFSGQLWALLGEQLEQHQRPDPPPRTPLPAPNWVVFPGLTTAQIQQATFGSLGAEDGPRE